ncbi:hypothetical protein ACHAXT_004578 [Thalassiosira profunda]
MPTLHAKSDDDADDDSSGAQPADDEAMSDADLQQQRLALGDLFKSSPGESSDASSDVNDAPVLTTSRKQRLEREIELLRRLDPEHPDNNSEYSDLQNQELVVSELWGLWYGERGPMNERKLRAIEETLMDPDMWGDAEKKYLALISEHCGDGDALDLSYWVEPANRLATLLFLMERMEESKQWCERILECKPWHIGALNGVVMVCMRLGDKEGVLKYSQMGLPNLTPEMRNARKKWVKKNVALAEMNLSGLEERSRKAYGDPDRGGNYSDLDSSRDSEGTSDPIDESEWQ